jgi:hypothetical protein
VELTEKQNAIIGEYNTTISPLPVIGTSEITLHCHYFITNSLTLRMS